MFYTRFSACCLVFTLLYLPTSAQPFPCDGRLILATQTDFTKTYRVNFGPFGAIFYEQMAQYLNDGFDALGFNPKDNYIYAVQDQTNSIVRLRFDGSFETLGTAPQLNDLVVYAGDCTPEGLYVCHEKGSGQLLFFEVLDGFQLVEQLDLYWDPDSENSGPFSTRIEDFAIDPNNPSVAYAFQGNRNEDELLPATTRGYILRINLDLNDANAGMVTPMAEIDDNIIRQLGGLFFTAGGALYGYGSPTTGPDPVQNRLISINPFTGDAFVQGLFGPSAPITDGCSCPYNLSFINNVSPRDITCSDDELTFTLTINNRSNEPLADLILTDTLPEGMTITSVTGDFNGTVAAGTGIGTNVITINDLVVGPRDIVVVEISADIIDVATGLLPNQAQLANLPPLFGGVRQSDDPATTGFIGDATLFSSIPVPIDDVELEITHPSDCLASNDGQVRISSPLLLVDQPYRIRMVNLQWEEFPYEVVIDQDNAFVLDSLPPGDYLLLQVTPENSRCSFGWRDTEISIVAPNEQLQATATTNSPICEGSPLRLDGTLSPGGEITWKGPEAFAAWELSAVIDSALTTQSGNYEMIATYGACEQRDTLEVVVSPAIEASIDGPLEYCERDPLQLTAEGNGELTAFQWSGPDNLFDTSRQVKVSSIAPANEGLYQVIIDNGSCLDTADVMVTVLPSPTITLPRLIQTDFCEPIQLNPEISGDTDVTFTWTPAEEGLSCYDCPAPGVLVPFQPKYRLSVVNDLMCADTADVSIALSMEKLLFVPNVFSPNFDGINDRIQVFPACGVSRINSLEIADRWGAVVYSQTAIDQLAPQEYWDGRVGGKMAAPGVYVWLAEIELVDGSTQRLSGDVLLLR